MEIGATKSVQERLKTTNGSEVHIDIYDDRMEIYSP